MKKTSISIFIILICYLGYGQTYPVTQNLGNTATTKVKTNALEGKLIITAFTDTTAANTEGYLKNYDGSLIKTTSPINALWYRVLDSAKWVQILPTGGGSGGTRAWLDGGNYNVFGDGNGNAVFGTLNLNGVKLTTNATTRLILNKTGIQAETANTVPLGVDTVTKDITYSTGGGGSSSWLLAGNTGTNPLNDFIGTTDSVDFVVKTKALERLRVNANGALGVGTGTDYGTSGYVLQSNGNGTSPTWVIHNNNFDATVDFSVNADPNTGGTTFSPNTPQLTTKIYVSTIDGSQWTWNGTAYVIYTSIGWNTFGNAGTDPLVNYIGTSDNEDFVVRVFNTEVGRFGTSNKISFNGGNATANMSIALSEGAASGDHSFAAASSTASGSNSVAFSQGSSSGENAVSFSNGVASGDQSAAFSFGTSSGHFSNSFGFGSKSKSYAGTVIGQYNDSTNATSSTSYNALNRVFQIGNGTADASRSNAMTVLFNGKTGIGTTTPDSTLHVVGGFKYVNGSQANGYVLTSDANGGATWAAASGGGLTNGTTAMSGFTNTYIPYNNAGTIGQYAISGTGNVAMTTSPTFTTPALGTPSSGTVTNLTGTASININGTVGATTRNTGAFTTGSFTGDVTVSSGSRIAVGAQETGVDLAISKAGLGSNLYMWTHSASVPTALLLLNDASTKSMRFQLYPTSYSTSGIERADEGALFTVSMPFNMGTYNNYNADFWTNNTRRGGISGSGAVDFTGAMRLSNYGAGTATFDASGNITSVSDERLKTAIKPYTSGLKQLLLLKPIQYKWNEKSGNETKETYAGFSAQNVKSAIPYGTGENKDGYLSLQERAIVATLVNAVKEQQQQIEELKREIIKLQNK